MDRHENTHPDQIHVVIADDDSAIRDSLYEAVKLAGYRCSLACNGTEVLTIMEKEPVDVVITDIMMPVLNGIELTKIIKEKYETDVIMMTGFLADFSYEECIDLGVSDFISKPASIIEVLIRLKRVLRERIILKENASLYRETLTMAENERNIRNMFQKFVPKEIVEKIILGSKAGKAMIDEFKILTILNIDIRDYSNLSKRVGPQKTVTILNHFFSIMGGIVFRNQGIVDKYLGDGFLAIFGAPISSPADADNAVTAALAMQNSMAGVTAYIQKRFGSSLTMGISIHTGEMVVGNIGFDKKMDYTVIGDSVNSAFRLQSLCKPWPNGILISEKTYHACQLSIDVEEIGHYKADNNSEKLKIYRVLGLQKAAK